jgi:hypothetical protein
MVWRLTIDNVAADVVARREHGSQCRRLSMTWKSMMWVVNNVEVDTVGYCRCGGPPVGLIGVCSNMFSRLVGSGEGK